MSEQAQGGTQNADGGTVAAAQTVDSTTESQQQEPGLQHALKDVQKFKKAAQDALSELAKLQKQIKESEEQKLQTEQQYKTLYERTKAEKEEVQNKYDSLGRSLLVDRKMSAVKIAAQKAGIIDSAIEDLELLDLDGIEVETTSTGKVNVLGADEYIASLKAKRPYWFGGKTVQKVNSGGGSTLETGQPITAAKIVELEREGKRKGDMTEYYKAYGLYQKQRLEAVKK